MRRFLNTFCMLALCFAVVYAIPEAEPEVEAAEEPTVEYLPPSEESDTKVNKDGYRYTTIRRLRYRQRRDVSQEYLPTTTEEPSQEYLPPDNSIDTKVDDNGYQYKTIRRLKLRRHRRDVSEIAAPSNEYLPPADAENASEMKTIVDKNGYRYKSVRRLKFRRSRREIVAAAAEEAKNGTDGASTPANEYLPPVTDAQANAPVENKTEVNSAALGKDGYRYKTVRRIRYRYRY